MGWSTSSLNEVPPRGSRFGTISCVVGWIDALLHRRRHRHDLAGRARLVDVLEGAVGQGVGTGLADVVRVEGRVRGDGPQLAGLDLLHDDVARQGLALGHHVGDLVLRVPLQVGVDGQRDVGAVLGRLVDLLGTGDRRPVLGALVDELARRALEGAVGHDLHAAARGAVLLHEPDEGRRRHPGRVDAAGRRLAVDAGDAEQADLAPRDGRHVLGDDAVLVPHQLRYQRFRRRAEQRRQLLGGADDADDRARAVDLAAVRRQHLLVGVDRLALDARGEDDPVAVEDLAAERRLHVGHDPLVERRLLDGGRVERLDPQQLGGEHGEDEHGGHEHEPDAAVRVRDEGAAAPAPARPRWRHGMASVVMGRVRVGVRSRVRSRCGSRGRSRPVPVWWRPGPVRAPAGRAAAPPAQVTTLSRWSSLAGWADPDDRAVREPDERHALGRHHAQLLGLGGEVARGAQVVDGLGELLLLVGQRPGLPLKVLQLVDP